MSRPRSFRLLGCLVLSTALLSSACIQTPPHRAEILYVAIPPPPDPAEVEGGAPSPSYVWVTGRYEWNGVEYVWLPGQWEERPFDRAVWVSGKWRRTQRGWVWIDGHWS